MREESLTKADGRRSECDSCGRSLKWWQLIPLVSYPVLRGKCAYCQERIDIKIWFAEIIGLLSALPVAVYLDRLFTLNLNISWLQLLGAMIFIVSVMILLYLAISDLFTYTINTKATVGLAFGLLVLNAASLILSSQVPEIAQLGLGTVQNLLAALIYGSGVYILIKATAQRGMGYGDLYLAIATGLYLAWPRTLAAFYITVISATLVGVLMAVRSRKWRGLQVPLVPFFLFGFAYGAVFGFQIFDILFPGLRIWLSV